MARIILRGLPVSPGIAIAELILFRDAHSYEKRRIVADDVEAEIEALEHASAQVCACLQKTMRSIPENLTEYKDIISAQMELARDEKIIGGAKARIRHRMICASWALSETVAELCSLFQNMPDPYLRDRAQDIRLMGQSIGDFLGGGKDALISASNCILAAHDLSPADVMELKLDNIQGIVTVEGGVTSHTAILARGLKVPAVVGVPALFRAASTGDNAIIDGLSGLVLLDPDEDDLNFYRRRKSNYNSYESEVLGSAHLGARTLDGVSVRVCANLENPAELASLDKSGSEGIGLYRTEFAWLGDKLPDEESLVREYRTVLEHAAPMRVVFRTLDIGADKILPADESLYEPNPALGLRGIRFCLEKKEIFRTQLRALLRAAHKANAAIMLPMVSALWEVEEAASIIDDVAKELAAQNLPCAEKVPLGIMVETPAAVMISDVLAAKCDFLSIGTNDLLHYLMAIDRNNRHVAYLHEPLHPAFTRSLKKVIDAGHKAGKEVSVCGEIAADPFGVALLVGLGTDKLSAAPHFVPGIKHMLRHLDVSKCAPLAQKAINEVNTAKTRKLLAEALRQSLGDDLLYHNTFISSERRA